MVVLRSLALAAALAVAEAASAHVSVQPASAAAESYQVLRFGVGHGCDGKATTALRIEIPAEVSVARPQSRPGWRLRIERGPGDTVTAIVWQGGLPADQFEEFVVLTKLPAGAGPLAFPATQTCGDSEIRWGDAPGDTHAPAKRPAPLLNLTPAGGAPVGHPH